MKKQNLWILSFTLLLSISTTYVLLDTFVIPRTYAVIASDTVELNISSEETTEIMDALITDTSYIDDNININISFYNEYDTSIYVVDIQLSDISYLQTAFAENSYGKNVKDTTSTIAEDSNAILAINGDFYGARTTGYVIRNGILYRSTSAGNNQEDLVIYEDGSFENITEGTISAEELLSNGALQAFSFGPSLISNSEIVVQSNDEVDKANSTVNPRTSIGIISPLHYIIVVADGRTTESTGLTLYNLAEFMSSFGVTDAYNLDGGGSSTLYFNGEIINNPTTTGKNIEERQVSDIVYIGY